jgi:hypothetical protein
MLGSDYISLAISRKTNPNMQSPIHATEECVRDGEPGSIKFVKKKTQCLVESLWRDI